MFFRDTAPFDLLRHKIVPELIDRRARTGAARIRIWSAACSTGQELYSIAILLKELLGDPDRYGVRLLGTDISDDAVARASRGLLQPGRDLARAERSPARPSTSSRRAGGWQIRDEIRAMASFKKLNLMAGLLGARDDSTSSSAAMWRSTSPSATGSRCSGAWNGRWSRMATW